MGAFFGTRLAGSLDVTIQSTTGAVNATFAITGIGSAVSASVPTTASNVVVNPTIELLYVTPEVHLRADVPAVQPGGVAVSATDRGSPI